MKKNLGWESAIIKVLENTGEAMIYTAIAEEIANQELRSKLGATPANTVNAIMNRSINEKSDESPFVRTGRGIYALRSALEDVPNQRGKQIGEDSDTHSGMVRSLGMYWRASEVNWKRNPRLLGQQQAGSDVLDFCTQIGIYLLHDRERVIYVGRSIDRAMGQRLFEHTRDRLNGRWDRFSWFGLKAVSDDGKLEEVEPINSSVSVLISTMEAILIEAMEPPQNRRRGDQLSAIEYLQAADPESGDDKKKLIASLLTQI